MNILGLAVYTLIAFAFAWFLFTVGRAMMQLKSVLKSIEKYEKTPNQSTWIEKYFFGWAFWGQSSIMKSMVNAMGDGFVTGWYKVSGVLFILFGIFFLLGTAALWVINLTQ